MFLHPCMLISNVLLHSQCISLMNTVGSCSLHDIILIICWYVITAPQCFINLYFFVLKISFTKFTCLDVYQPINRWNMHFKKSNIIFFSELRWSLLLYTSVCPQHLFSPLGTELSQSRDHWKTPMRPYTQTCSACPCRPVEATDYPVLVVTLPYTLHFGRLLLM